MPTFYQEVAVDVELDEFDEDELIEELQDRGFTVTKGIVEDNTDLESVAWLLTLNKTEEALIQLERLLPQLKGITDKIKSAGVV